MQAVYISEMPVVTAEEDSALAYISLMDAFIAMLSYSLFGGQGVTPISSRVTQIY